MKSPPLRDLVIKLCTYVMGSLMGTIALECDGTSSLLAEPR